MPQQRADAWIGWQVICDTIWQVMPRSSRMVISSTALFGSNLIDLAAAAVSVVVIVVVVVVMVVVVKNSSYCCVCSSCHVCSSSSSSCWCCGSWSCSSSINSCFVPVVVPEAVVILATAEFINSSSIIYQHSFLSVTITLWLNNKINDTLGDFTFWLSPWLNLLVEPKSRLSRRWAKKWSRIFRLD